MPVLDCWMLVMDVVGGCCRQMLLCCWWMLLLNEGVRALAKPASLPNGYSGSLINNAHQRSSQQPKMAIVAVPLVGGAANVMCLNV